MVPNNRMTIEYEGNSIVGDIDAEKLLDAFIKSYPGEPPGSLTPTSATFLTGLHVGTKASTIEFYWTRYGDVPTELVMAYIRLLVSKSHKFEQIGAGPETGTWYYGEEGRSIPSSLNKYTESEWRLERSPLTFQSVESGLGLL